MSFDGWAKGGPLERAGALRAGLQISNAAATALGPMLNDLEYDADAAAVVAISHDLRTLLDRVREIESRMTEPTQAFVDRAIAAAQKDDRERRDRDHEDDLRLIAEQVEHNKRFQENRRK